MNKLLEWEAIEKDGQGNDLFVIEQLVYKKRRGTILAQIWQHEDTSFSMTTYEDELKGNLDGNEHQGSYLELKEKSNEIFEVWL